jgi:hypothetical protein
MITELRSQQEGQHGQRVLRVQQVDAFHDDPERAAWVALVRAGRRG